MIFLIFWQILVNDWLPRVADLVDAMRKFWQDLVPRNSSYGGRATILFNCIHSLMSRQIMGLIDRSLQYLLKTINVYKVKKKQFKMFY